MRPRTLLPGIFKGSRPAASTRAPSSSPSLPTPYASTPAVSFDRRSLASAPKGDRRIVVLPNASFRRCPIFLQAPRCRAHAPPDGRPRDRPSGSPTRRRRFSGWHDRHGFTNVNIARPLPVGFEERCARTTTPPHFHSALITSPPPTS